jgi:RNA-binding protein YlmH
MIQLNLGIGYTFYGDLLEKETATFLMVSAGNVKYLSTGLCERERTVR